MGQTTPFIGIFIPAAGDTNYEQSFAAGMINIDQHDHSGGPNKGVPITASGLADFSVTYNKLNSNVVDVTTGIGTQGSPYQNRLEMLGILKNLYALAVASGVGFVSMNGHVVAGRTFTVGTGLTISNANGVSGNPLISLTSAVATSVIGTAGQIAVTPTANTYQVALAPIVQKSTQPLFMAQIGSSQDDVTGDGTAYKVLFPTVTVNQGSYYDSSTATFTVPVTGNYLLGVNLYIGDITSGSVTTNQTEIAFWVDGVATRTVFYGDTRAINAGGTSRVQLSGTEFIKLTVGQLVTVVLTVQSTPSLKRIDIDEAYFSGVLLW